MVGSDDKHINYDLDYIKQLLKRRSKPKKKKRVKYEPSVATLLAARHVARLHKYYIYPIIGSGKVAYDWYEMWNMLLMRFNKFKPLYRFSTMWLLKRTFYSNANDQMFRTSFGDGVYSTIKNLLLYNFMVDLVKVHDSVVPFIIEDIMEFFGIGTIVFLRHVYSEYHDLIDQILFKVIRNRFNSRGNLDLSKDQPFMLYTGDLKRFKLVWDARGSAVDKFFIKPRKAFKPKWSQAIIDKMLDSTGDPVDDIYDDENKI